MPETTEVQAAYLAGHFDGEGCIYMRARQRHVEVTLAVSGCHRPNLERYLVFGGSVYPVKRVVKGNRRDQWQWRVGNVVQVAAMLRRVRPFLCEKRAQADVMLEYLADRTGGVDGLSRGRQYEAQLKSLKHQEFPHDNVDIRSGSDGPSADKPAMDIVTD